MRFINLNNKIQHHYKVKKGLTGTFDYERLNIGNPKGKCSISVFEKLGSEGAIKIITEKLFEKLLSDENMIKHLKNQLINNVKDKHRKFLVMITGGHKKYSYRPLDELRNECEWEKTDYSLYLKYLKETLNELDFEESLVSCILNDIEKLKNNIITKD